MSVLAVEHPRLDQSTLPKGRRMRPEQRVAMRLGALDSLLATNDAALVLTYWAHVDRLRIPSSLFVDVVDRMDLSVPEHVCPVEMLERWRAVDGVAVTKVLLDAVRAQKVTHPDRILGRRVKRGICRCTCCGGRINASS